MIRSSCPLCRIIGISIPSIKHISLSIWNLNIYACYKLSIIIWNKYYIYSLIPFHVLKCSFIWIISNCHYPICLQCHITFHSIFSEIPYSSILSIPSSKHISWHLWSSRSFYFFSTLHIHRLNQCSSIIKINCKSFLYCSISIRLLIIYFKFWNINYSFLILINFCFSIISFYSSFTSFCFSIFFSCFSTIFSCFSTIFSCFILKIFQFNIIIS